MDADLIGRANGVGQKAPLGGASSYSSLEAAEYYTAEVIANRLAEIKAYLQSGVTRPQAFDWEFGQSTGRWVQQYGSSAQNVTGARVVIKPDASMPGGYKIITGHPIPSSAVKP